MEVLVSSPTLDTEFSGTRTSPERCGQYYSSAPTSPSRIREFYREFDFFSTLNDGPSDSSPLIQKATNENKGDEGDDGFAFYVSEESNTLSLTAEELFDGGKIKPLKMNQFISSKTPLVSQGKRVIRDEKQRETEERRGRDRTPAALSSSNSGRRATRSHSPYRVSDYTWDEERQRQQHQSIKEESSSSSNSTASQSKSSRKWRLRDFLLFRSASEGRGSSKDPFRKYSVLYRKPEEVKISSFRSTESPTGATRRGPVSPHELHYAVKRAESLDLKKKTFLPYKQGILGRLAGLGSFTR